MWGRRRASRYPRRPLSRCFGDGGDARPTYFNEQMSARFLMPIPKVRPKHFIGMTSRPAGLGQT